MQIERVAHSSDPRFGEALAIYHEAFPLNERRPDSLMAKGLDNGKFEMQVGLIGGQVVLMAYFFPVPEMAYVFLDYLAVSHTQRGKGLGGIFLQGFGESLRQTGRRFILECEDPDFGENPEQRERRIRFYLENGGAVLQNVPYFLPSFGGSQPIEMTLMVLPGKAGEQLPGAEVRQLICALYRDAYGRSETDETLQNILPKVPETVTLTDALEDA